MVQQFVNRNDETQFLEEAYRAKDSNLIIIYGRRRIGKTELVKQFVKDKPHIYFLADERGDRQNINELQNLMSTFLNDDLFAKADFVDWVELFNDFTARIRKKFVLIIDEFPYLISSNKAIPSIFQKIWDENLSNKNICFILLGSSVSTMENYTLSYRSPLYGRRTGQWKLGELKLKDLKEFFPKYSLEDLIKVYSLTGGVPSYLVNLNPNISFQQNLVENVFKPGKFLYMDVEFILKEEFRSKAHYFNILKAIATRKTKYGDIVNFTQLDKTIISKYLDNLILLHVIKKEFPVTQKKETRNAVYIFEDNYFNFWFRYIYPNKSLIEGDRIKDFFAFFKKDFPIYLSNIYEMVCREFVFDILKYPKVGRWWHKEEEIDVVGVNVNNDMLFGECKWQNNVNPKDKLARLIEKSKLVDKKKSGSVKYAIFAKSFKNKYEEPDLLLFDLMDLEKQLFA